MRFIWGITQRLRAFGELLNDGRLDPATTTFVQVAVPSRGDVPGYDEEKDDYICYLSDHRLPNLRVNREYALMSRDKVIAMLIILSAFAA